MNVRLVQLLEGKKSGVKDLMQEENMDIKYAEIHGEIQNGNFVLNLIYLICLFYVLKMESSKSKMQGNK